MRPSNSQIIWNLQISSFFMNIFKNCHSWFFFFFEYLSIENFRYFIFIATCLINDFCQNDGQPLLNGVICKTPMDNIKTKLFRILIYENTSTHTVKNQLYYLRSLLFFHFKWWIFMFIGKLTFCTLQIEEHLVELVRQ